MRLVRRFLSVAAVGAALAVAFAVPSYAATTPTAAPVQAASIMVQAVPLVPGSCPSGKVCIYASANFSLGPGLFSGSNADWGSAFGSSGGKCVAGSTAASDNKGGWNDCVSSLANNVAGATFTFYINDNCSGSNFSLAPGTQNSNLGGGIFNDALSSDKRSGTAC